MNFTKAAQHSNREEQQHAHAVAPATWPVADGTVASVTFNERPPSPAFEPLGASVVSSGGEKSLPAKRRDRPDFIRVSALVFMHVGCLGVLWVGVSRLALALAAFFYFTRAFALTAFYHRYFSHRAFRTSRWFQFLGALLGCTALQKGPLWWAAHHRDHHRFADSEGDVHSPHVHGFSWAHFGWFLTPANNELRANLVRDWLKFPELRYLDRYAAAIALLFALMLYGGAKSFRPCFPGRERTGDNSSCGASSSRRWFSTT